NLSSNEENHGAVYRQGGLQALVKLTHSRDDVCQRYAGRWASVFLAATRRCGCASSRDNLVKPFLALAESPYLSTA
ncbi:unnamed protein product, partial [Heterosigma akashiwo]